MTVMGVNTLLEIANRMKKEETGTLGSMLCSNPKIARLFIWNVVTEVVVTPNTAISPAIASTNVLYSS